MANFKQDEVLGQHVFVELAPCLNNYLVAGLNNRLNTAAFVAWVMSAQFGSTARLKYGFLSP